MLIRTQGHKKAEIIQSNDLAGDAALPCGKSRRIDYVSAGIARQEAARLTSQGHRVKASGSSLFIWYRDRDSRKREELNAYKAQGKAYLPASTKQGREEQKEIVERMLREQLALLG